MPASQYIQYWAFVNCLQVTTAVEEALEWLSENQDAEEDEYRDKLKEVEDACGPIMASAHQTSGEEDEDLASHDEL